MTEKITVDLILDTLKGYVEAKTPIGPHLWIDAAQKLNALLSDEHDNLFNLQQQVSLKKVEFIEGGKSAAEAKARVEATDVYKEMSKQKAKIDRINEMIRISKIQGRLKSDEARGYH